MSRAGAAKGGKEKTRPPPSTPVAATEIVPGKFNESDWNAMVERDSAEDFIHDIVDEILGNTMDTIYKSYIEKQLLPFTITQAKDAILQIIEWQFLARDEGEDQGIDESGWIQDEEPDAAVTDCWAQGSVPKTEVPMPSVILEEEEEPVVVEEKNEEEPERVVAEPELEDKVSEGEAPADAELEAVAAAAAESSRMQEEKKKQKKKFRPYRGKLKSASVSKMTESLDETEMKMYTTEMKASMTPEEISSNILNMPASCHSILKVQNGRPPGNKDVEYDEMGNVLSVMKLDAEKLPNHKVSVKYQVVDPAVEAAQARLEAMRRGRFIAPSQKTLGKGIKGKRMGSDSTTTGKVSLKHSRKPIITALPPSLLESMDVSAGVVVTEAGRTKKGQSRYIRKTDVLEQHQKDLQPVTIKIKANTISVSDLLDRNTPILRPIDETRPLPPIVPTPPLGGTQVS